MSGLAQSKDAGKEMALAADKLSLFAAPKLDSGKATAEHLPEANGSESEQPPVSENVEQQNLKVGGFEKLNAMFGGGTVFRLP